LIISRIAESTGLDIGYIAKVVRSANYRYKIYQIPKRNKKGTREIAHPSSELKLLQRWLKNNVFSFFPTHDAVYSYKTGIGIRDIAKIHRQNNYLLRIDFVNYFPSIKGPDISYFLRNNLDKMSFQITQKDLKVIRQIVCKDDKLTIGSPTSPIISNLILYKSDSNWHKKAQEMDIVYSRYADDIYLSTNKPNLLEKFFKDFEKDIKKSKYPKLKINKKKTVFTSKKHKRIVTGLFLTSENKVSVGRNKKRYIKGLVYRFKNKQLSNEDTAYLRGYLAYLNAVEPQFLNSLKKKYGKKVINLILTTPLIQRK